MIFHNIFLRAGNTFLDGTHKELTLKEKNKLRTSVHLKDLLKMKS